MNRNERQPIGRRLQQLAATILATAMLMISFNVAAATPAQATEWKCDQWYRCAQHLSKDEVKWLADQSGADVSRSAGGGIAGVVTLVVWWGHAPMLKKYAEWDKCVKFQFSLAPWDSQWMMAYDC